MPLNEWKKFRLSPPITITSLLWTIYCLVSSVRSFSPKIKIPVSPRETDIIGVGMSSAYKVILRLCPNLKCGFLNANAINSQYYFWNRDWLFVYFVSNSVFKDSELSISLLRVIGCGALALGTLSYLMLDLTHKKELKPGLITLSTFHSLVAIAQIYSFIGGMTNALVIIIHSGFAVSFTSVSWQRIRQ